MVLLTRPLSQVGNLQSLLEDSDLDYVCLLYTSDAADE